MQNYMEKTQNPVTIEKLQDEMEKLKDTLMRLEFQVATLWNFDAGKTISGMEAYEPPRPATAKSQSCKNCKYMRMPHKSNAHYTCGQRHETIEPTWVCGLYNDKNNQRISDPVATCSH